VELHDRQQPQAVERVPVMNDGSFEFRNVATGNYEVRLLIVTVMRFAASTSV
jgi:hypothetical protein